MGVVDVVIIAVVVALVALAVRSLVRSGKDGCADCGSREGCAAHAAGGACPAAERMVRHADAALKTEK